MAAGVQEWSSAQRRPVGGPVKDQVCHGGAGSPSLSSSDVSAVAMQMLQTGYLNLELRIAALLRAVRVPSLQIYTMSARFLAGLGAVAIHGALSAHRSRRGSVRR